MYYILMDWYEYAIHTLKGLTPVQKGEKWGVIDKVGKIIIPFEYESVSVFNKGEDELNMSNINKKTKSYQRLWFNADGELI